VFGPYRSRDEALLFAIDAAKEIGQRESAAQVLVEDVKDCFLTDGPTASRRDCRPPDGARTNHRIVIDKRRNRARDGSLSFAQLL